MRMNIRRITSALLASLAMSLCLGACTGFFNVIAFNVGLTKKGSAGYHMSAGIYPFGEKYLMLLGQLDARFSVIDVSDPASPVKAVDNDTSLGLGGGPVAFKDLVCYGMTASGALMIVDFRSDPKTPTVADAAFCASGVLAIAVEGSTLAVLSASGIDLYSLADPLKPSLGGTLALAGPFDSGSSILMDSSRIAVAGTEKIFLLAHSSSSSVSLKGSFSIDAPVPHKQCSGMAYNGNYLYYLTNAGLVPVNISDQGSPAKKDLVDLGDIYTGTVGKFDGSYGDDYIAVLKGMMVVSSWYGIHVFDLFNPLKPEVLSTDATDDTLDRCLCVDGMAATEKMLYVGVYGNPGSLGIYAW